MSLNFDCLNFVLQLILFKTIIINDVFFVIYHFLYAFILIQLRLNFH